jgi:hypothetical protein
LRIAKAGWAVAAFVLLGSGGCDYWNNLVEEKTVTRADLEVTVVDAWTGETFKDADCRDSLSGAGLAADGQGHYRIQGGSTGLYEIFCNHRWYSQGAAKIHLAKGGAHDTVKLARRADSGYWYPDPKRRVAIPEHERGYVRFPTDLDWQVTPWDTTGKFRYEWTFRSATTLSHGHLAGREELDQESYSPRFRARAATETGVQEGKDTAILTVYSLLNGGQAGDSVGSDTLYFEWIRNRKPFIHFTAPTDSTPYKVGCGSEPVTVHVLLEAGDLDGRCTSRNYWAVNAPSVLLKDSILTCEVLPFTLPLSRPTQPGVLQPDGSQTYGNTLYADIVDDNGEKGIDSVTIITHTNAPPTDTLRIKHDSAAFYQVNGTYFVGEPVTFEIKGRDTDGGITRMDIEWIRASNGAVTAEPPWRSVDPHGEGLPDYMVTRVFDTPDDYRVVSRALDDCGEWTDSVSVPFTVQKNILPTIQFTHPDTSIKDGGDSLEVKFKLSITDPDAYTVGKDGIKLLQINWDTSDSLVDTTRRQFIRENPYTHKYPMPRPGTILSIGIHVEDQHTGKADTTIRIP